MQKEQRRKEKREEKVAKRLERKRQSQNPALTEPEPEPVAPIESGTEQLV